jgi:hypothetical protein
LLEPGAFNDYSAGPEDVVQDEKDEAVLIECPTLVLWGEEFAIGGQNVGFSFYMERDAAKSLVRLATAVWPPSSRGTSQQVNAALLHFLEDTYGLRTPGVIADSFSALLHTDKQV